MTRVPPHSVEIEQLVLGAIMLAPDKIHIVAGVLEPSTFYLEPHRFVFEACRALTERGVPCDFPAVLDELRKSDKLEKAGGAGYVTAMVNAVPSAAHVEHHAGLIAEKYALRRLISKSTEIIADCYAQADEPGVVIERARRRINAIETGRPQSGGVSLASAAVEVMTQVSRGDSAVVGFEPPAWLPRTFRSAFAEGILPGEMIVVQAPSSGGKTTFAAQFAYSVAAAGGNVAFVTREDLGAGHARRVLAHFALTPWGVIRNNPADWNDLPPKMPDWFGDPERFVLITDAADWGGVQRAISKIKSPKLIVLDYFQKMRTGHDRVQEIEKIANGLKDIAVDCGCIALGLSQENKQGESKWAAAIYEAADHYWVLDPPAVNARGTDRTHEVRLKITKNRNGPTWSTKIYWEPAIFRYWPEREN